MYSRVQRLLIALMFALVAAGVTLVAASAQDGAPPPAKVSGNVERLYSLPYGIPDDLGRGCTWKGR